MLDKIKSSIAAGIQSGVSNFKNYREDFRDEENFYLVEDGFKFGNYKKNLGIEKGYNYNTIVYAIISRVAQLASEIPIEAVKINSKGEEEILLEGDYYDFVHKPNEQSNYKTLTFEAIVYLLANGNIMETFTIPSTFSTPIERYILAPQCIRIDCIETFSGFKPTNYKYQYARKTYSYTPEEILHVKRFNPNINDMYPCYGLSPLQAAYRTLTASNDNLKAQASVIKNRGFGGFLTSRSKRALTDTEKKWAESALKKRIGGGDKFGKIGVMSGDMDYISIGMSPSDLQLLQSGLMTTRDLCSVFGLSSKMFNDPNGSTYNNVKEDGKKVYSDAVLPPLNLYIDAFNSKYSKMFRESEGGDVFVRLKTNSIKALQEDEAKNAVRQRSKMQTITTIAEGVPEKWSREGAINMLVDILQLPTEEIERYFI